MLRYKVIEIFTSEEARWQGKPVYSAIVQHVSNLKIPARCIVKRGVEGSYESGEVATRSLEVLSYNMPLHINIILPACEFERVLSSVEEMVSDGIVATRDIEVLSHKTRGRLLPRQTRVREIMTPNPKKAGTKTPLSEVTKILLSSNDFTALPVVDEEDRPVGIISQGDLIYKAGMPMRLGLLAESDRERVGAVLETMAAKLAGEIMTQPAVTIGQDKMVTEAVNLMLEKEVKRLPVVDDSGKLVGVISRVDVFHAAMKECPDWMAFHKQHVLVDGLRFVSDIMRRDAHCVLPDTTIEEVMSIIDCNNIQRVCVSDKEGRLLGLISDRDLLIAFSDRYPGIWDYFVSKIPFTERGRRNRELGEHLRARTAAEVMNTNIVTVREDAPIAEAIQLMLKGSIKRLPVIDAEGRFKGMISRDSLLREGFASL